MYAPSLPGFTVRLTQVNACYGHTAVADQRLDDLSISQRGFNDDEENIDCIDYCFSFIEGYASDSTSRVVEFRWQ